MSIKARILIFSDWFTPAFKAGGPIQSCANFASHMKESYSIYVFTSNHDLDREEKLNGIIEDKWIKTNEGINVFYASPSFTNWKAIYRLIGDIKPAYLYLNSMFSLYFTIYPLLMKWCRIIRGQIVLAPRGMLKKTALSFKPVKKRIFLSCFKMLGVFQGVIFQATNIEEEKNIKELIGKNARVFNIPNFPCFQGPLVLPPLKLPGELRIIFIGRIHPIKNLHLLLNSLCNVDQRVFLTVVGMKEDLQYWELCQRIAFSLPDNIIVKFLDNLPHEEILNLLLEHHLFSLPSEGENFGHAIFEALSAGRPVLISDQTPWRNLEKVKAGWDLPIKDTGLFTEKINEFVSMSHEELSIWCKCAWQYCNEYIQLSNIKEQYLKLFK
jgi:glycosyltransferase involved in cell wall biosynthesis